MISGCFFDCFFGRSFLDGEVHGMDCVGGTNIDTLAAKLTLLIVDIREIVCDGDCIVCAFLETFREIGRASCLTPAWPPAFWAHVRDDRPPRRRSGD